MQGKTPSAEWNASPEGAGVFSTPPRIHATATGFNAGDPCKIPVHNEPFERAQPPEFYLKIDVLGPAGHWDEELSTAESRRRSLTQLQQSLRSSSSILMLLVISLFHKTKVDAEMLKKRSKMSYEDSDINPRVKHTRARGKFSATFLSLMRPPCERSNIHILTLEPFCFRKLCVLFNIRTSTASISDFVLETQGHTLRLSACTCQRPSASWGWRHSLRPQNIGAKSAKVSVVSSIAHGAAWYWVRVAPWIHEKEAAAKGSNRRRREWQAEKAARTPKAQAQ